MGDMIVKDNLNGFTENCTEMGNTFGLFTKQSNEEHQTPVKNEQFKAVNSDCKKLIDCHDIDNKKKPCVAHRTQCIASKCELAKDCGSDVSKANIEKLKEVQSNWIELHKCIRFIYKNAISSVPRFINEKIPKRITDSVKVLIEKLCEEDCQQLFIRVEVLVRDFVLEAKDRLKDLQNNVDDIPVLYLRGLLASYGAFCVAADNLAPFIPQLDALLMKRFSVNFQLLNKYLFQTCLYADAFVQNNVPLYISQLRTSNSDEHFSNQELVHSYLAFDDEMTDIASRWLDVKKMILKLNKKRVLSNCKQPLLLEDWKLYREHRELAASRTWQLRSVKRDLSEFDVQLLSLLDDITNHMCELEISSNIKTVLSTCRNCNSDISCSCDDCTIKHILNCVETPPTSPGHNASENTHSFNSTELLQQFQAMSKLNKNEVKAPYNSVIRDPQIPKSLAESLDDIIHTAPKSNKPPQSIPGEDDNTLYLCNNKVNKIQMPKNFLKLITDKVLTKSFVQNHDGDGKPDDVQCEAAPAAAKAPATNVVSAATTATPLTATSKVPVSTNVATSITHSSHAHHSQPVNTTAPTSDKPGRILKEVTKPTQNKLQCNHTYQAANKKTKETSTTTQACKDGCAEHGPVKNNKESKRCDCPHCEVFESTNAQASGKNNKTRDRLRIRLNEKRNKALKEKNTKIVEPKIVEPEVVTKAKGQENQAVDTSHPATSEDPRDIRDLINFIEGTDRNAKLINAQKRLAKKARRRERKLEEERLKEEERLRIEAERLLEEQRKLDELKRIEEARIRQEQAAKNKKNRSKNTGKSKDSHKSGKGHNNHTKNGPKTVSVEPSQYLPSNTTEKHKSTGTTGPMVTIKRVMECTNSEPTVTITLKGSTPDKDKLLYTLVNGQTDLGRSVEQVTSNVSKPEMSKSQKKKAKRELQKAVANNNNINTNINNNNNVNNNNIHSNTTATLSKKERKNKKKELNKIQNQKGQQNTNSSIKVESTNEVKKTIAAPLPPSNNISNTSNSVKTENTLNLHMLRLPPGITITKVDGPAVNRKLRLNPKNASPSAPAPSSPMQTSENRSGVIVVDTVKLKEVLPVVEQQQPAPVTSKKKKKKNKNKSAENTNTNGSSNIPQANIPFAYKISSDVQSIKSSNPNCNSIVTIKNPMFYQLQESLNSKINKPKIIEAPKDVRSQQASIIKGANGMVTIRSPRLHSGSSQPCNGHSEPIVPIHSVGSPLLPDLKPVIGPNTSVYKPVKTEITKPFNAQEILSGLPGIEITKINKNSARTKNECKVFQPADVSIIPTNIGNGTNGDVYKLFCDNMDWSLESVFAPKDIREDEELDADELELEAFKRFCQQSVPPKRKEKVAHLNVKDIVLKKKTSNNVC